MAASPIATLPGSPIKKNQGFFRQLLEKPQQVWLRKAFFQIHLWAGIIVALYIIAIGISGSILVFKEELMPKPRVSIGKLDYNACTAAQLTHAIDLANTAVPNMKAFLASCPTPANGLFTITVREEPKHISGARSRRPQNAGAEGGPRQQLTQRTVYIHPKAWQIVGTADRETSWLETVEQFHVNLLLGRSGRLWNGIGASVLLVLTLTGIVLWWPGIRNWTRSLKLDFRKSWKRINWDLHSAMGFWTLFFTLTWALTSMYFTWPKLFTVPIEKFTTITTATYPGAQVRRAMSQPPAPDVSLNVTSMIEEAQRQSPNGHLEGVFYGNGPRPIFTIYMAKSIMGDYSNADFVYFDQRSGRHLYTWHRGDNHTLGDWLIWLIAPLHFGTTWGQGVKVLWALLGLALPALTITGLIMYWNRWLGKRYYKLRRR
jgi:uncharacterized iron-regulated membrane protein